MSVQLLKTTYVNLTVALETKLGDKKEKKGTNTQEDRTSEFCPFT